MQTISPALAVNCACVIVAAGRGTRFGGFKQLAPVAGKPLLLYAIEAIAPVDFAARLLVLPAEWIEGSIWDELKRDFPLLGRFTAVSGGAERAVSVRAGVAAVPVSCQYVAVHDGARPFPPIAATARCLEMLHTHPGLAAAIVASAVTDTIKQVGPGDVIVGTLDREELRRAETPQVVRRDLLLEALAAPTAAGATDEADVLERAGYRTACVLHEDFNPKVTRPSDIRLVEGWLSGGNGERGMDRQEKGEE